MAQDVALHWLSSVGPLALVALMVLNRIGAPTWAAVLLVAAGGFAQQGVFAVAPTVACALVGLALGDWLAYSLGRQSVQRLLQRFEQRSVVRQAQQTLAQHSALAIFLSRFLFLFLAVPINFLASTMQVRRSTFMFTAAFGNLVFVVVYFGVGYLFSGNWAVLSQAFSRMPLAVYVLAGMVGGGVFVVAWFSRRQRVLQRRKKGERETNASH